MAKKASNLLLIGGVGLVTWLLLRKKSAIPTPGSATPPVTAVQQPQQLPVQATTPAPISSGAIPQTEYAAVQNWANQDGRPPILAMAAARDRSEYDGMYDLIQAWAAVPPGQAWNPTPDETEFWNTLRNKYDPQHKYW